MNKTTLNKITEFIRSAFVSYTGEKNGDYTPYAEQAEKALVAEIDNGGFQPIKSRPADKLAKGARTTSHNKKARFYFLVAKDGCSCPILFKPVYTGKGSDRAFLRWILVPDSDCIISESELVSFHECFNADLRGKARGDILTRIIADSARQAAEDISNNARQKGANALADAVEHNNVLTAMTAPYMLMSDEDWNNIGKRMVAAMPTIAGVSGSDLLAYVESKRNPEQDTTDDAGE